MGPPKTKARRSKTPPPGSCPVGDIQSIKSTGTIENIRTFRHYIIEDVFCLEKGEELLLCVATDHKDFGHYLKIYNECGPLPLNRVNGRTFIQFMVCWAENAER